MPTEIKVPTLGESVTTATVARWIRQPGDAVAADEAVVELETDKVSVEVSAPQAGVLGAHAVAEGDEVEVGAVLTTIEAGTGTGATAAVATEPAPDTTTTDGASNAPGAASSYLPQPAVASAADSVMQAVPASSGNVAKPQPPSPTGAPAAPAVEVGETDYDLIVIGSGPGGYVCALRAAQLGLKVACVEKRATLGGTCLNIGCIPSKALLQSSESFHEAKEGMAAHGVIVGEVTLDLARMHARKNEVVAANTKGVEFLFKKNGVTWLKGAGRITAPNTVAVTGEGGARDFRAKHVVIATGSDSVSLPGIEIDEKRIVSSTGALELDRVPGRLVVIGGGVIGLELGSVWHRLGAEVTVIEYLDRLVPGIDGEVAKTFERVLSKQGLRFRLGHKVTGVETSEAGAVVTVEKAKGGAPETIEADIVLVAIGRRAVTDGLGLAEVGVETDERGRVKVDGHFATNIPGIYAIGDVIAGPMLAHKAEDEGVALAEMLAGQAGHVNYGVIPGVVYTWPEVAGVGKIEEELKAEGVAYKVGKFPFSANGRARAMNATDGFVKILADKKTDRLLGAHIIGPDAGTLIAELATAMEFGASAEDVARICHAHPTLSEAVKEAALAADGRALHV